MKNSLLLIYLILLTFLPSCLDESSPNFLNAEETIVDGASAEAAVIGLYSAMQQSGYYGEAFLLTSEGHTDNATTGGYQNLSLDQIGNREVTGVNVISESIWTAIFRVIANANLILKFLPAIDDLDIRQKNHLEGEVRAIRAMAHFDLLRYYGEHWNINSTAGIPVIQSPQGLKDRPARASVLASYQFIISEMSKAAGLIDQQIKDKAFINIHTINALLARIYLYRGENEKAVEHATKVIASGDFQLLDAVRYQDVFRTKLSTESIFELLFDSQNRSGYNGSTYSRTDALRSELNYLAAKNLEDFFKGRPGDVRGLLLNFSTNDNDATILPDGRTQKYRGETTRDNPAFIIRYAEMFLIRAEALGNIKGLADLNFLRQKRGLAVLTPGQVSTAEDFLLAILNERRAELNFEGHRYFDLARKRKINSVLNISDFRSVFPIPNREMIANPNLKQNPGY
ncbi:MAG: RagB/SusD family nutrient uptake outer membrane protein [Bacteroidetes bacterium]|nr:RagB/SusD family nutrient uptake outer membrane protein [Bacteroidota bacterium]